MIVCISNSVFQTKSFRKIGLVVCFISSLFFLIIQLTFAQQTKIPAPTNLTGKFIEGSSGMTDAGKIKLTWDWSSNVPSHKYGPYIIHRSLLNTPPFQIIGSALTTEYIDASLTEDDTVYYYYVRKLGPDSASSEPSEIISVRVPLIERVIIISNPPTIGMVGSMYNYQVRAISTVPNDILKYRLVSDSKNVIPPGMSIDTNTGLIQWTPTAEGLYSVLAEVENGSGVKIQQAFTICIDPFLEFASLSGQVVNDKGVGIQNVKVSAYFISKDPASTTNCRGNRLEPPHASTDHLGKYNFDSLRTGEYILMAVPPSSDFSTLFWKNAESSIEADKFILVKNSASTADFVLNSVTSKRVVKVCGTVRNIYGKPIPRAIVKTIIVDASTNSVIQTDGTNNITYTDLAGNYCSTIPANTTIVLSITASGYYSEFYFDKTSILTAYRLSFDNDKDNFDVILRERTGKQKIFGEVRGHNDKVQSWILLYSLTKDGPKSMETILTDSDGSYQIDDIPEQRIFIQCIPLNLTHYSPAYYSGSPLIVQDWNQSKSLAVGGSMMNTNIYVENISATGLGRAEGKIVDESHRPIAGAVVRAVSDDDDILGVAISNFSGNFQINGLSEGSFNLKTDKIGFSQSSTNSAFIHYGTTPEAKGIFVRMTSVAMPTSIESDAVPPSVVLYQNYPNPISSTNIDANSTTITFTLPAQKYVRLYVHDVLGREVSTLINGALPAGIHSIQLSANTVKPGVYFYSLIADQKVVSKKLIVTK